MASHSVFDLEALKRLIDDRIDARLESRKGNGHATSRRLVSIEEAAVYSGRTEAAVRALLSSGKLPKVKWDRRVMVDLKDLDQLIEKGKL